MIQSIRIISAREQECFRLTSEEQEEVTRLGSVSPIVPVESTYPSTKNLRCKRNDKWMINSEGGET